jgi:hypothetical protein
MRTFSATLPFTVYCLPFTLLMTIACGTVPPLRERIDVGREPFAIFVGGSGMRGDLYAVRAAGGPVFPLTFTTVAELRPALAPNGTDVAFLRGESPKDSTPATLWVMNLLNGGERELELPPEAGRPERVVWSSDGTSLIVQTAKDLYRVVPPPGKFASETIPAAERASAESSLAVLLGDPVFARVIPCRRGDLCVVTRRRGKPAILAQAATDPVRWGADSVAFFTTGQLLQIRPLARGRPRLAHWSDVPHRPRQVTYFPGPQPPPAQ